MLGAVGSLGSLCTALHLEPGVGTNLNVPLDRVNLVPRAFPLKNGWGHPFFKGKALGTRLGQGIWVYFGYGFRPPCPKQGI